MPTSTAFPPLAAVLDMGASAIRLDIELDTTGEVRVIEDASRGVLLGREAFSTRVIRSKTAVTGLSALDGFRRLSHTYRVRRTRAIGTSAVREARSGNVFLDRIRGRRRLFDQLQSEPGLTPRDRVLFEVAALLDVGTFVSLRAQHKHSQYLLATSQIFGLPDVETPGPRVRAINGSAMR